MGEETMRVRGVRRTLGVLPPRDLEEVFDVCDFGRHLDGCTSRSYGGCGVNKRRSLYRSKNCPALIKLRFVGRGIFGSRLSRLNFRRRE
jgi:hypothetical protein